MRLLELDKADSFCLTREFLEHDVLPPYAILSHTWEEGNEVTYKDLREGTGREKSGYAKIRKCGQQAYCDGMEYFWVDTCCIDKENQVELSRSINSMFRWYRNADRCYVYLPDVPPCGDKSDSQWESAFRKSRWFTRGWTLQELLAPSSLEFFSQDWQSLGGKRCLESLIHETTGIPYSALQGTPLAHFNDNERLLWMEPRQTKLPEDKAYALLGIFDVQIPLVYGEGAEGAYGRLQKEVDKVNQCIRDLRHDKRRIQDANGGLLANSYRWILANTEFQQWRDSNQQRQLLWIKGDPGKGKTMLLCGIINELSSAMPKRGLLAYFFCQATDLRINNATAVLRGLIYLLLTYQPSLVRHVQKKYDHAGKSLFEDTNAWVALSEILSSILLDPNLNDVYLIVDALDECVVDLPRLLDFIVQEFSVVPAAQRSSAQNRVKWIFSSRNWPDIEERLEMVKGETKVRLSLEINATSISKAVSTFILERVDQLAEMKKYDQKTRYAVFQHLIQNANDTFLWVALVCRDLEQIPRWKTLARLKAFPPGLDSLYGQMIQKMRDSEDSELCKQILGIITIVYRPITVEELTSFIDMLEGMAGDDPDSLQKIIQLCGSFLTVRQGTIYFVHQSAKDYLLSRALDEIFPSGTRESHHLVFSKSLETMSKTLRRDMYGLCELGYPTEQVKEPIPDPIASARYSCIYWVDHLQDYSSDLTQVPELHDNESVHKFIKEKFIYWLEALSLSRAIPRGIISVSKLERALKGRLKLHSLTLLDLIQDAHRFIMTHKWAIENHPLQTYASALLFSPKNSLIRKYFKHEQVEGVNISPSLEEWSRCLLTLESHSGRVFSATFSHDSTQIVSAAEDHTLKICDAASGDCLQTIETPCHHLTRIFISRDSNQLASTADKCTAKLWDLRSGNCIQTFHGHEDMVCSVVLSNDSTWMASASHDGTVKVWDVISGDCIQTLEGHAGFVCSMALSDDCTLLASSSYDSTVKIWEVRTLGNSKCLYTLTDHRDPVDEVTFSPNSMLLASRSNRVGEATLKLWDMKNKGECLFTLEEQGVWGCGMAFSHDSKWLALTSSTNTIKIWDMSNYTSCLQNLEGHGLNISSLSFSHDSTRLASASQDRTVKIWDTSNINQSSQLSNGHSDGILSISFHLESNTFISTSNSRHHQEIKIWDASHTGQCVQTLKSNDNLIISVARSPDSRWLVSWSMGQVVKIWDTHSGKCVRTIEGGLDHVKFKASPRGSTWLVTASIRYVNIWDVSKEEALWTHTSDMPIFRFKFSEDLGRLATRDIFGTVKILDLRNNGCILVLGPDYKSWEAMGFSHDSALFALTKKDNSIDIWDVGTSICIHTLKGHEAPAISIAFSPNSAWFASAARDHKLKIWDLRTGNSLLTFSIGMVLNRQISFDNKEPLLHIDFGTLDLSILLDPDAIQHDSGPQIPRYKGAGLSIDGKWITYNSANIVWLPSDRRVNGALPECFVVSGNKICIGTGSGNVWSCEIQID